MSVEPVFLDSGAFLSFLVRTAPAHERMVPLFERAPPHLYTSVLVIAETYDWLRRRTAGGEAIFNDLLRALPDLEVLRADFGHARAVERKLAAHREPDLSYLAASSLVFLGRHQILEVWGTDPLLGMEGARVRPGPAAAS